MLTGNSLRELTSTEFAWKRMKRHDEAWANPCGGDNVSHVVWCELSNSNFVELDAYDSNHAIRLIESWLKSDDCITASYRTVNKDGTLGKCIEIFDALGSLSNRHTYFWDTIHIFGTNKNEN